MPRNRSKTPFETSVFSATPAAMLAIVQAGQAEGEFVRGDVVLVEFPDQGREHGRIRCGHGEQTDFGVGDRLDTGQRGENP